MHKFITVLLSIVFVLLVISICIILSSLLFWGLGMLVCYVFNIAYNWTFLHGFVIALLFMTCGWMLKGNKNE